MGFVHHLLLAMLLLLVGFSPLPGEGQQVKVLFTPTICHMHCSNGRCINRCQQGNATTLLSGETTRAVEGASGFRVCEYRGGTGEPTVPFIGFWVEMMGPWEETCPQ